VTVKRSISGLDQLNMPNKAYMHDTPLKAYRAWKDAPHRVSLPPRKMRTAHRARRTSRRVRWVLQRCHPVSEQNRTGWQCRPSRRRFDVSPDVVSPDAKHLSSFAVHPMRSIYPLSQCTRCEASILFRSAPDAKHLSRFGLTRRVASYREQPVAAIMLPSSATIHHLLGDPSREYFAPSEVE
jgi:hypothetical protein